MHGSFKPIVDDYATGSHIFILEYNAYKDECVYYMEQIKVALQELKWNLNYAANGKTTRASAWYTRSGCKCDYIYGGTAWPAHEFLPWMDTFCDNLNTFLNLDLEPNAMNFNRYDSGEHSLGFHADNDPLFKDDKGESTIVSLSSGAERSFEIKHNYSFTADFKELLKDGDILIMSGRTQLNYQHAIPKHVYEVIPSVEAALLP